MQDLKPKDIQYFENMIWNLKQKPLGQNILRQKPEEPQNEISLVRHQNRIYYSTVLAGPPAPAQVSARGPSSATVKLIQGLFDQHRDLSFFILRNRIWTTEPIGPMNRGMVKVTAKRVTRIEPRQHDFHSDTSSTNELVLVGDANDFIYPVQAILDENSIEIPPHVLSAEEGLRLSLRIAASVRRGRILHDHNRAIGAVLCGPGGDVLSWAANSAALNKTLHAEVRAVQQYFKETGNLIPVGAKIYVSLKPCQMCSGLIAESCENLESIQVYYAQDDEGPLARNTAIESRLVKL